jgi:hypothetical protein
MVSGMYAGFHDASSFPCVGDYGRGVVARIVAINDRLQLDTHDAERIANDALSAL